MDESDQNFFSFSSTEISEKPAEEPEKKSSNQVRTRGGQGHALSIAQIFSIHYSNELSFTTGFFVNFRTLTLMFCHIEDMSNHTCHIIKQFFESTRTTEIVSEGSRRLSGRGCRQEGRRSHRHVLEGDSLYHLSHRSRSRLLWSEHPV